MTDNTLTLLSGKHAQNVLLYGDAGTGKSATVKAVVNEFFGEGLRLIQITKADLPLLPEIMEQIHDNPLKFILFVDDLTFAAGDDSFGTLRAVLEGSVAARPANTVIYAASSSRYLEPAYLADADAESPVPDVMPEQQALAGRFGIRVRFRRPDREAYLSFVQKLAEKYSLHTEPAVLMQKAEEFAQRSGGRSPRAAKQLIEQLSAGSCEE